MRKTLPPAQRSLLVSVRRHSILLRTHHERLSATSLQLLGFVSIVEASDGWWLTATEYGIAEAEKMGAVA